jgi:hypothetical protein
MLLRVSYFFRGTLILPNADSIDDFGDFNEDIKFPLDSCDWRCAGTFGRNLERFSEKCPPNERVP